MIMICAILTIPAVERRLDTKSQTYWQPVRIKWIRVGLNCWRLQPGVKLLSNVHRLIRIDMILHFHNGQTWKFWEFFKFLQDDNILIQVKVKQKNSTATNWLFVVFWKFSKWIMSSLFNHILLLNRHQTATKCHQISLACHRHWLYRPVLETQAPV